MILFEFYKKIYIKFFFIIILFIFYIIKTFNILTHNLDNIV